MVTTSYPSPPLRCPNTKTTVPRSNVSTGRAVGSMRSDGLWPAGAAGRGLRGRPPAAGSSPRRPSPRAGYARVRRPGPVPQKPAAPPPGTQPPPLAAAAPPGAPQDTPLAPRPRSPATPPAPAGTAAAPHHQQPGSNPRPPAAPDTPRTPPGCAAPPAAAPRQRPHRPAGRADRAGHRGQVRPRRRGVRPHRQYRRRNTMHPTDERGMCTSTTGSIRACFQTNECGVLPNLLVRVPLSLTTSWYQWGRWG